jgi:LysM repeat protein
MTMTKAAIVNKETNESIPVMFNPPEYQLQKTNQFAEVGIPGLGSSLLQFVRGSAQTLTMELFFDTTGSQPDVQGRDVRDFTKRVVDLTVPNAKTHAPPRLLVMWKSLVFPCILESVTQQFDYFNAEGKPLRARLNVTFKEFELPETLLASPPLESADRAKQRVSRQGDTLQSIAAQEYDDPRLWRAIAQANNIDNPLTIPVGQGLIIPSLK